MGSAGEDTFIFNTLIPGGVSQEPEKMLWGFRRSKYIRLRGLEENNFTEEIEFPFEL